MKAFFKYVFPWALIVGGIALITVAFSMGAYKDINKIGDDNLNITLEETQINSLKLSANGLDVKVIKGNKNQIIATNIDEELLSYSSEGNILSIEYDKKERGFLSMATIKSTNYLPKIVIELNSNELTNLEIELGVGVVKINDLKVETALLDMGAGSINILNSEVDNMGCELGVGSIVAKRNSFGNTSISIGVGELKLFTNQDNKYYDLNVDVGIGNKTINDNINTLENSEGKYNLNVDIGIGNAIINIY